MSIVQEIMDLVGPFLPLIARVGDGAAEEVGRELPSRIARSLPILARKRSLAGLDAATLRAELEADSELQEQLAKALGIQVHQTQVVFNDKMKVQGDWVMGDKNEYRRD